MSLQQFIDKPMSDAYDKFGAFFAYNNDQFNEQRQPNVDYVRMSSGLICPKENARVLNKELNRIIDEGIQEDIKTNGIPNIIKRELANYECYYTGDITDCVEALEAYNIPEALIWPVYYAERKNYDF